MPDRNPYEERAANLLKAEIKRKGLTYAQVVDRMAANGVAENERNLRNKLSRGKFSAAYFLQVLEAVGVFEMRLEPRAVEQ
ncbi:MAG: DUF6471 domain-containing protein [Pseudomonadota bacterium]